MLAAIRPANNVHDGLGGNKAMGPSLESVVVVSDSVSSDKQAGLTVCLKEIIGVIHPQRQWSLVCISG